MEQRARSAGIGRATGPGFVIRPPGRRRPYPGLQAALDVGLMAVALTAMAALLLEHGFYRLPGWLSMRALHAVQTVAALLMFAERAWRFLLAENARTRFKLRWLDAVLPVLAVSFGLAAERYGPAWLLAAKSYVLLAMLAGGVRLYLRTVSSGIHPARLLVGSFLFVILIGTGLLLLPRSMVPTEPALPFDNAMFIATSATCVTGLSMCDLGNQFSRMGQTVVMCLIQVGGLGIMTFGTLFVLLGRQPLGVRHTAAVSEAVSEQSVGQITRMVKFIVLSTLLIEAVGAALMLPLWETGGGGVFAAVFHSVSAFCNAGFALPSDNLVSLRNTWQVMIVVPALIILGGIGFPVLMDVVASLPVASRYLVRMHRRVPGVPRPRWSLHTKIALSTTAMLLVVGTAGLLAVERRPAGAKLGAAQHDTGEQARSKFNDWQRMSDADRLGQMWFHAVSARTAGFNTINLDHLSNAGKLWLIFLMLIGGSPASTAGGMKTVTFAVLVLVIWTALRRRERVEAFGRSLPDSFIRRAVMVGVLYCLLVAGITLALSVAQGPSARFIDVFFESASACGTVGLSLGETARLTVAGKFVIILGMFVGRVGTLTLLMGLAGAGQPARYQYPSENLVIG